MRTPNRIASGEAALDEALEAALRDNDRLTERYLAAEQQVSDLANLFVAVSSLHAAVDRAGVVSVVREIVANLVGSEELAIFEVQPRSGWLRLVAVSGVAEGILGDLEIGEGVIGTVADTGRPLVRREGGSGTSGSDESITACLPLRIGTSVMGALAIFRLLPHKGTLEDGDLDLFDVLSTHAASALLFARLYGEARA